MASCKLIIEDEVNIKLEGVSVDVRRKLSNALKFEVPYARYMPQYKLGRWDGKVAFFGLGGSGYVNHLDIINDVLYKQGYEIVDIEDRRHPVDLKFEAIKEDFWDLPLLRKNDVPKALGTELGPIQGQLGVQKVTKRDPKPTKELPTH